MERFNRTITTRLKLFCLLLWLAGMLFPMAWASKFNPFWDAWFNRLFAPAWMHVVMHAALYAVLAFGLKILFARHLNGIRFLGAVLFVAFVQEGLQLWGAGRLPGWGEVFDVLVDLGGAAAGVFVWQCLQRRQATVMNEVQK